MKTTLARRSASARRSYWTRPEPGLTQWIRPPYVDEADAILPGEIGGRERGGGPHAEVERGPGRRARLGEGVEHEDDVGVPLALLPGHVERSEPQRGAPVHLPDPVARRKLADVAGLDALADGGRDIVAE